MRPERLAELEAYYSQNDDLYESHGAVLELVYAVKAQEAELRAAREVVEAVRGTYLFGSAAEALAAYDQVVGS